MNSPLRTTLIDNGKAMEIIIKPYNYIDNIPVLCSDEIQGYKCISIRNIGNILVINSKMLNKMNDENIKALAWQMIIQLSSGIYKQEYKIENDYLIDSLVAKICGKEAIINLLVFLSNYEDTNEKQLNQLNLRCTYIEKNIDLFINNGSLINKNDIIKRAKLANLFGR